MSSDSSSGTHTKRTRTCVLLGEVAQRAHHRRERRPSCRRRRGRTAGRPRRAARTARRGRARRRGGRGGRASAPSAGPTSAVSTGSSPNVASWTSISRASSQPLMNPAHARIPSGVEVSYVISRSARARSSTRSRVAVSSARRRSASRGELGERLVAALVALGLAALLGVLLGALQALLGLAQAVGDRARVELVDREHLVDEHERVRARHLQEALALGEAHDLGLRLVQPQLGRVEHRQQRLVVGQHADAAHGGARGQHLDLVVEGLALRGEDLDGERRARHR